MELKSLNHKIYISISNEPWNEVRRHVASRTLDQVIDHFWREHSHSLWKNTLDQIHEAQIEEI